MKKIIFLLLVFSSCYTFAQPDLMEKERLKELIEERKERFESYFSSIEKKSGIFGNKTKKDIQKSNAVLIEIVRTDNHIISVLSRALDFKSFEKTSFNYDKLAQDEKINTLTAENERLSSKIKLVEDENQNISGKLRGNRIILWSILGIVIAWYFRNRKRQVL